MACQLKRDLTPLYRVYLFITDYVSRSRPNLSEIFMKKPLYSKRCYS